MQNFSYICNISLFTYYVNTTEKRKTAYFLILSLSSYLFFCLLITLCLMTKRGATPQHLYLDAPLRHEDSERMSVIVLCAAALGGEI